MGSSCFSALFWIVVHWVTGYLFQYTLDPAADEPIRIMAELRIPSIEDLNLFSDDVSSGEYWVKRFTDRYTKEVICPIYHAKSVAQSISSDRSTQHMLKFFWQGVFFAFALIRTLNCLPDFGFETKLLQWKIIPAVIIFVICIVGDIIGKGSTITLVQRLKLFL